MSVGLFCCVSRSLLSCPGVDCWTYQHLAAIKNLEPLSRTQKAMVGGWVWVRAEWVGVWDGLMGGWVGVQNVFVLGRFWCLQGGSLARPLFSRRRKRDLMLTRGEFWQGLPFLKPLFSKKKKLMLQGGSIARPLFLNQMKKGEILRNFFLLLLILALSGDLKKRKKVLC